ncbi:uncharacterized protein LOC34618449 [Cyclospora cayetanensis]|uniref:Uncharacterized protein LOC34618449 n=1 Tax=Cyclospora cayetanensis TaxID=88456 RepID=A0A6P6RQM0_9EIME|nr:uncharacterized protein LOC34618449 [Cyclospora cayetanensis]
MGVESTSSNECLHEAALNAAEASEADSSCTVAATTKREFDKASEAASSATNCIATCSSEGEAGKQADAPLDGKGDGTEGGASGCATAADTCLDTLAQPSFSPPKQRRRRGPRIPAVATRSLPNRDSRIAADLQNKFVVECERLGWRTQSSRSNNTSTSGSKSNSSGDVAEKRRKDKQSASAFGSSATSSSSARQPKKELSKRGGRPPRDRRKGRVVDSAPSRSRSGLSCSGAPRGRPRGSAKASRTNKKAEDGKSSLKASNPRPPPPTQSRRPRRHAADRAAAAIVAAAAPMHDGFLVLDIPAKRLRQQQQPLAGKKQQRRTTKWRGDEDAKGEDATTIQKREGGECLEEMRNEPKEGNPEAGLHAFKEEVDLTGAECRDEIANERREAQDPMQTELESKAESTAEELRLLEKALEEEEFDRRRVEPYELEVRIELGSAVLENARSRTPEITPAKSRLVHARNPPRASGLQFCRKSLLPAATVHDTNDQHTWDLVGGSFVRSSRTPMHCADPLAGIWAAHVLPPFPCIETSGPIKKNNRNPHWRGQAVHKTEANERDEKVPFISPQMNMDWQRHTHTPHLEVFWAAKLERTLADTSDRQRYRKHQRPPDFKLLQMNRNVAENVMRTAAEKPRDLARRKGT